MAYSKGDPGLMTVAAATSSRSGVSKLFIVAENAVEQRGKGKQDGDVKVVHASGACLLQCATLEARPTKHSVVQSPAREIYLDCVS